MLYTLCRVPCTNIIITKIELHETVYPYPYSDFLLFDLWPCAGSRFVLSIKAVNAVNLQKNYNAGKDVSLETKKDAQEAEINVHHSSEYKSYIKIPINRTE